MELWTGQAKRRVEIWVSCTQEDESIRSTKGSLVKFTLKPPVFTPPGTHHFLFFLRLFCCWFFGFDVGWRRWLHVVCLPFLFVNRFAIWYSSVIWFADGLSRCDSTSAQLSHARSHLLWWKFPLKPSTQWYNRFRWWRWIDVYLFTFTAATFTRRSWELPRHICTTVDDGSQLK